MISSLQPVISRWANSSNGLDALLDPWNVIFGIAVFLLARVLGLLYIINNIADETIRLRGRRQLLYNTIAFLVFFLTFLVRTLLKDGFAYQPGTGVIFMEPMKYLNNLITMWPLLLIFLVGVILLLLGIVRTVFSKTYIKGIWPAGFGVVMVVLVLLLIAGWNHTAFYPSNVDLQSSLTIANSCSSKTTLKAMFYVSLFLPVVFVYIYFAWRAIDKKKIESSDIKNDEAY